MNLINLDLGKWLYLIIYLFLPIVTLLYLIRVYGLETKEDAAKLAQKHLEQADYWTDIALKMVQSQTGTKSMTSLLHTIQHNLDETAELLNAETLTDAQRQTLSRAYNKAAARLTRLQKLNSSLPIHSTLSL
jgi:hypothetical protein